MWAKYKFFEAGISPKDFNKCKVKDIKEIMEIKSAIDEKASREAKINAAIRGMK